MHSIRIYFFAARPKTLWAGIAPVLIGTAMALDAGGFHWPSALVCFVVALTVQIGTNFANDYFDFIKGTDTSERIGPTRVTQAGLIAPAVMRNAFVLAFTVCFVASLYLGHRAGWWILVLGAVSIASGILYTAGPLPLGYIGLGDAFAFFFFGPVATGATHYVQTLRVDSNAVIAGLAPGFFAVAMITVNNLRDVAGDRRSGKRTPAVLFGPQFSKFEYLFSILLACLIPVVLHLRTGDHLYVIACALIIVAAIPSIRTVFLQGSGPLLNNVLAATGRMLLLYAIIFVIGWLL